MLYEFLLYFSTLITIAILYFLPGFLISLFFKKYSLLEKIMLSFLFSTILIILFGILFHISNLLWSKLLLIPYISFIVILTIIQRNQIRQLKIKKEIKLLLIIFFLILTYKAIINIFIKFYPSGADFITHYKTALFFLGKDWNLPENYLFLVNYLPYRTPGFYMILGFFLAIFGRQFWVCQLANIVINTVFIFPTYCLAKTLFNKKIAFISIIFLQIISFVEISLYIFAKMIIGYIVLTMLYLFIKKKGSDYIFGLLVGIGYLIHQLSLIFTISLFLPLFITNFKKKNLKNIISIIKIFVISLLIISPWLMINFMKYGTLSTSDYINLPLYTTNYGKGNYTTYEIWENFKKTPVTYIIGARIINFLTATTPIVLVFKIVSIFKPIIVSTHKISNFATDIAWHRYFLDSLPGNLTILLFIFSIIGFFKIYRYKRTLFYFILIPFIFYIFYYGWIVLAVVKSGISPIIPLFVMLGFWEVSKRKNADKWIKLIFIFALIEFAIFWMCYSLDINFTEDVVRTGGKNLSTEPIKITPIEEYDALFTAYKFFRI